MKIGMSVTDDTNIMAAAGQNHRMKATGTTPDIGITVTEDIAGEKETGAQNTKREITRSIPVSNTEGNNRKVTANNAVSFFESC